jgi:hypothetical protein
MFHILGEMKNALNGIISDVHLVCFQKRFIFVEWIFYFFMTNFEKNQVVN